jgi:hypothetical protein
MISNSESMRRWAVAAGALFILADVAGVASVLVLGSLLDGSSFLSGVVAGADRVAAAATLEALMGLACAGIALALYPVLRRVDAGLAIGAVGMRVVEGMVFLLAATALLALVAIGLDAQAAGTVGSDATGASAALLRALHAQTGTVASLPFAVGAFLYYWAFYRARLTPRWLAVWGLVGIVLYGAAAVWAMLSRTDFNGYPILLAPLGLQEIVLAVWLIAKGFNPLITSGPSRSDATAPAGR